VGDVFVEVVVDHDDRCGAAGGEAFDELDRVFPIFAEGEAVRVRFADLALFAEMIAELVGTAQRAGERAADFDLDFARRMLAEHGVEGDELEDVDRLEVELVGDPLDALGRDVAEGFLPEMEQRQRGAPLGDGIVRDQLVGLPFKPLRQSGRGMMMIDRTGIDFLRGNRLRGGIDDRAESFGGHDDKIALDRINKINRIRGRGILDGINEILRGGGWKC